MENPRRAATRMIIEDILLFLSFHIRPYLAHVAMMVVATLLVLYGNEFNRVVKRNIAHYNFVIRTLIFIVICAFGYGLLVTAVTPLLADFLRRIPQLYTGISVIAILITLGVLAERRRVI